eukprot:1213625-Pyramimonas_sp.AAC.1
MSRCLRAPSNDPSYTTLRVSEVIRKRPQDGTGGLGDGPRLLRGAHEGPKTAQEAPKRPSRAL